MPETSRDAAGPRAGADEILVAIPVLNEARHVDACIRSLMAGDPRLAGVRFVVADGGSTDGTQDIVRRLQAEFGNLALAANPGRLQAAAVNLVAAGARGTPVRYLVRCDAHAAYPPGYVTRVADTLAATGADSVVACMDAVGRTCFQKANAWIVDSPLGSGGSAHRGGMRSGYADHGHHAGFRLARFLALGGYDERFSHNEDAEYDQRLVAAGGRIWLDATIRHDYLPRDTVRGLARQYWNYGRGRARNLRKHRTWPKPRQMAPVAVLAGCAAGFVAAPVVPAALTVPAAYVGILAVASVAIAVRRRSACGLLAGLAAATMHLAWGAGFMREWLGGRRLS